MVNLFLYSEEDVNEAGEVEIRDAGKLEHLRKVLQVQLGSELRFGLIGGGRATGTLVRAEKDHMAFRLQADEAAQAVEEKKSGISVLMPVPRPSMVKLLLERLTTAGVDALFLIRSERSTKQYFQGKPLRDELMRQGVIKGAEQGVTTRLMEVHKYPDAEFPHFMAQHWENVMQQHVEQQDGVPVIKLLAHPGMRRNLVQAMARGLQLQPQQEVPPVFKVVLAIGPEGGWIPPEVGILKQRGFIPFHCGDRILRVDQAAQALLGQLQLVCDAAEWMLRDVPQPADAELDEQLLEEELQDVEEVRAQRKRLKQQ